MRNTFVVYFQIFRDFGCKKLKNSDKQETEQKCAESDRRHSYEILYVVIFEDDSMKVSTTPHILRGAKRCILIHSGQQRAATIYYDTYRVQIINENGEVLQDTLDNEYSIHISPFSFNCSAIISLSRGSKMVYSAKIWSNGENLLPPPLPPEVKVCLGPLQKMQGRMPDSQRKPIIR